jgi:hypothetical protein
MNKQHVESCSSDEWSDALQRWIVPGALTGVELGDDALEVEGGGRRW